MYENKTYENILNSMLSRIPGSLDTREGSVIYNALAPAAYELAQVYFHLDNFLKLPFVDTSEGEYLTKTCSQFGVTRKPATAAIKTGTFKDNQNNPFNIPIGSRFGIDGTVFIATKKLTDGFFEMTCELPGTIGNSPLGDLLPIDNIRGLATAILSSEIISVGTDVETDDALRLRTLTKIQLPSTSGNSNQYRQWALEVLGVGAAKVFPLWHGPGTIKVVIVDTERQPANAALIDAVTDYIEAVRPIGAAVTVTSGIGKIINVVSTVTIAPGYTLQGVTESFRTALTDYFKSITFNMTYVSQAKVGTILLGTPGILDYIDLSINGNSANIALSDEEIPIIGAVELGV